VGIEVRGMNNNNSGNPQTYSAKATFDDCLIEDAIIGVANYQINAHYPYFAAPARGSGGIIQATNTTFLNNIVSICMKSQQCYSSGVMANDKSFFKKCDFSCTAAPADGLNTTTLDYMFASLTEVEGVKFEGCNFVDYTAGNIWYGINALNAGFKVIDHCPSSANLPFQGTPCSGATHNYFTGFPIAGTGGSIGGAIVAQNNNTKFHAVTIENTSFYGNGNNIDVSGYNYPAITSNSIVTTGSHMSSMSNKFFGINIKACPGMRIEENTVTANSYSGWAGSYSQGSPAVGIAVVNSGIKVNDVYLNTITNMDWAMQAIGQNRAGSTGLSFLCNNMSSSNDVSNDIISAPEKYPNTSTIYFQTGLAANQVQTASGNLYAAGNKFDAKGTAPPSGVNRHYYNVVGPLQSNHAVHYYYYTSGTNQTPQYHNLGGSNGSITSATESSCGSKLNGVFTGPNPVLTGGGGIGDYGDGDDVEKIAYCRQVDDLILSYMYRDSEIVYIDSILLTLQNIEPIYDYKFIEGAAYGTQGNYQDALDLLDDMPNNLALTSDQEDWIANVRKIYEAAKEISDNANAWATDSTTYWDSLETNLKDDITDIAEDDAYFAKFMARAYLAQYEAAKYDPIIVWEDESGSKSGNLNTINLSTNSHDLLYPNPASDMLYVAAANNTKDKRMVVTDIAGKALMEIKLSAGNNGINIKSLSKGIYFVRIYEDNRASSVTKIVKE
jgi:hypothetical protein